MQFKAAEEKRVACWPALLSVIAAVHGSLTVGYAYGYTSTALEQLSELPDGYAFHLGSISAELFATLVPVGALFCCLVSGVVSDRIGRKKTLLLTGIPNAAGWILIVISPYITAAGPSVFKVIILTGRFLTGVACSGIYAAVPLYAAEVALPKQRGFIGTFHVLFIIIGVSMSYGVGAVRALSYSHSAVIATGMVLMCVVLVTVIPESPRWLVIKGHNTRALKALKFLRRSHEWATKEAGEIKKIADSTPKFTLVKQLHQLRKQYVCLPLAIFLCLVIVQHLCGQYIIEFYSSIILKEAEVNNPQTTATYSVGAAHFCGTLVSAVLVDRVGRKPLVVLGGIGVGIGAALLGTHFYITQPGLCQIEEDLPLNMSTTDTKLSTTMNNDTGHHTTETCNPQFAPLAICSLVVFSLGYSLGYRCVLSTVKTEITPLSVRGLVVGIIDCLGWVLIAASVGTYYDYEQAVRPYTAWWSFATVGFGGVLFALAFLPETKGKSLEDIEMIFRSKKSCCITVRKFLKEKEKGNHKSTPV